MNDTDTRVNWREIDSTTLEGKYSLNFEIARRLKMTIYDALRYDWCRNDGDAIDLVNDVPATFRLQSSAEGIWQAFFLAPVNTQAIDDTPALAICKAWLAWHDAKSDKLSASDTESEDA